MKMTTKPIIDANISFQSEGRLLQELGERLVANPEVALVELVKNSYDADASSCHVFITDDVLTIRDDGRGMSLGDFCNKWMKIASGAKADEQLSPTYQRKLTGAKGIGRFAVRFLGRHLSLISTAYDAERKTFTRLEAEFDWELFDARQDITQIKIPYKLFLETDNQKTGTTLIIGKLKEGLINAFNDKVRTEVLRIVNPINGLERGHFSKKNIREKEDPGFEVILPPRATDEKAEVTNIASDVLKNYWARLTISLTPTDSVKEKNLIYKIKFHNDAEPVVIHKQHLNSSLKKGAFADIRFFPRRAGIFSGKGFSGHAAWQWIHDNSGVAIVDHGFRIKPYGYSEDDWLQIGQDHQTNKRTWRSPIMLEHFPIPNEIKIKESLNPTLFLPANHQLIGAVFVESGHAHSHLSNIDLIPSADREGYLNNQAFQELRDIIRAGIEMLALKDKENEERKQEEAAKQAFVSAREDIKSALKVIKSTTTLVEKDKNRLIEEYSRLAKSIEEVETYNRQARQGLEVMSLLGVVAGFMTHENKRVLFDLNQMILAIKKLNSKYSELSTYVSPLEQSYHDLQNQIDYSSTFIGAVQNKMKSSFGSRAQVQHIIDKFGHHATSRGIIIKNEIGKDLLTPNVPIALYSGILLNLYTNALKAVIADATPNRSHVICIKAWNEPKWHTIEVLDNGIGIPPSMQNRIWDPLFTTTSNLNNPFGSGMGLGLSVIKKLLSDIGGKIKLVNPPPNFTTCFRVELPFSKGDVL
jgi:signal transduction histidine kinase